MDWPRYEPVVMGTHGQPVYALAFSRDGKRLISASRDHSAKVWELPARREASTLRGHSGRIFDATYIGDSPRAVTASIDGTIRLWDADRFSGDNLFAQQQSRGQVGFSWDGRLLAWGGGDHIHLHDVSHRRTVRRLPGGRFSLSPSRQQLALITPGHQLELWSLES